MNTRIFGSSVLGLALATSTFFASPALAVDYTWFGDEGAFTDPVNWSPEGVPGIGDNALVDGGTVNIAEGDALEFNYLRITRGGSPADAEAHVIQTGGDVILTNLRVGDGNTHVGTFEMSGGSMTIPSGSGQVIVGANAGSDGTMTVKGTAMFDNLGTSNLRFAVGDTGTGRLYIQDFASVTSTRMTIGNNAAGVGTLEVSGGSLSIYEHLLIGRNDGNGTATISGSAQVTVASVVTLAADGTGLGSGILNLNGGSLTTSGITKGSGTGTVHFNGGTVIALADSPDFFSGLDGANLHVQAGGLKFNTDFYFVTVTQGMNGTGGLTKLGEGILTLEGQNTFIGVSQVAEGTLVIADGASITGTLEVANGATLQVEGALSLDQAIVLNLVTGANVVLDFEGTQTISELRINGVAVASDEYTLAELQNLAGGVNFSGNAAAVLNVTPVPEPGTFALLAIGACVGAWRMRRRTSIRS